VVNANIATGIPVHKINSVVFAEQQAAAVDKASTLPTASLLAQVNKIFTQMRSDGSLAQLSVQWFGIDLTQMPTDNLVITSTPEILSLPTPQPTPQSLLSECNDGIDNDGDGQIDFPADPQCTSIKDDREAK
jgi:hypothetical protein